MAQLHSSIEPWNVGGKDVLPAADRIMGWRAAGAVLSAVCLAGMAMWVGFGSTGVQSTELLSWKAVDAPMPMTVGEDQIQRTRSELEGEERVLSQKLYAALRMQAKEGPQDSSSAHNIAHLENRAKILSAELGVGRTSAESGQEQMLSQGFTAKIPTSESSAPGVPPPSVMLHVDGSQSKEPINVNIYMPDNVKGSVERFHSASLLRRQGQSADARIEEELRQQDMDIQDLMSASHENTHRAQLKAASPPLWNAVRGHLQSLSINRVHVADDSKRHDSSDSAIKAEIRRTVRQVSHNLMVTAPPYSDADASMDGMGDTTQALPAVNAQVQAHMAGADKKAPTSFAAAQAELSRAAEKVQQDATVAHIKERTSRANAVQESTYPTSSVSHVAVRESYGLNARAGKDGGEEIGGRNAVMFSARRSHDVKGGSEQAEFRGQLHAKDGAVQSSRVKTSDISNDGGIPPAHSVSSPEAGSQPDASEQKEFGRSSIADAAGSTDDGKRLQYMREAAYVNGQKRDVVYQQKRKLKRSRMEDALKTVEEDAMRRDREEQEQRERVQQTSEQDVSQDERLTPSASSRSSKGMPRREKTSSQQTVTKQSSLYSAPYDHRERADGFKQTEKGSPSDLPESKTQLKTEAVEEMDKLSAAAGSVPSVPITGSISDLISKKEFNEYERDSIIHSMDTGEEKHKAKSKNLFSSPRGSHGVSDGEASASNNDMLKALEKAAGETEAHAPAGDRSRVGNTGGSSTVGRSGDGGRGDSSTALWNDEERRLDSKEGSLERGLGALMRVADRQKGELESMNSVNTWLHGSA